MQRIQLSIKQNADTGLQSFKSFPGAYDVMEPLRSIPNSVVKRCYGEDTRRVTAR